jgi:hypothetical protein
MKTALNIETGGRTARSVLDCGSPLPLLNRGQDSASPSARGLAQSKTWRFTLLYFCFLLSVFSFRASGQSYSLDWYKISGGGGTSTGGPMTGTNYSVTGTIGQPDASGSMHGGNYSVTGGFWSLYAVQTPGAPLLAITVVGNRAVVSWDATVTGWTLQTNANLATPTWGNFLGTVVNNSVTNAPPKGNLFFRLKQ